MAKPGIHCRILSLTLVACLLADPLTAGGFAISSPHQTSLSIAASPIFIEQSLMLPLSDFARRAYSRAPAHMWKMVSILGLGAVVVAAPHMSVSTKEVLLLMNSVMAWRWFEFLSHQWATFKGPSLPTWFMNQKTDGPDQGDSRSENSGPVRNFPNLLREKGYTPVREIFSGGSTSRTFIVQRDGRDVLVKYCDWEGVDGNGSPWIIRQAEKLRLIQDTYAVEARKLYPRVIDDYHSGAVAYVAMEYFEGAQSITRYFLEDPSMTDALMSDEIEDVLTLMADHHYRHHREPYSDEVRTNHIDRILHRVPLLGLHRGAIYSHLVAGHPFQLGPIRYRDASFFFEDLLRQPRIMINGQAYPNLPVLLRILDDQGDEIQRRFGPTHFSNLVHGDLPLRNVLRLPDGSKRIIDVRGQNIHAHSPTKTSIEYDLSKIAHGFFWELILDGLYTLDGDWKDGCFQFNLEFDRGESPQRYLRIWRQFPEMLKKHSGLAQWLGDPNRGWLAHVQFGEALNYASDAIHRFAQDSSGHDSLAFYLQATQNVTDFLKQQGLLTQETLDRLTDTPVLPSIRADVPASLLDREFFYQKIHDFDPDVIVLDMDYVVTHPLTALDDKKNQANYRELLRLLGEGRQVVLETGQDYDVVQVTIVGPLRRALERGDLLTLSNLAVVYKLDGGAFGFDEESREMSYRRPVDIDESRRRTHLQHLGTLFLDDLLEHLSEKEFLGLPSDLVQAARTRFVTHPLDLLQSKTPNSQRPEYMLLDTEATGPVYLRDDGNMVTLELAHGKPAFCEFVGPRLRNITQMFIQQNASPAFYGPSFINVSETEKGTYLPQLIKDRMRSFTPQERPLRIVVAGDSSNDRPMLLQSLWQRWFPSGDCLVLPIFLGQDPELFQSLESGALWSPLPEVEGGLDLLSAIGQSQGSFRRTSPHAKLNVVQAVVLAGGQSSRLFPVDKLTLELGAGGETLTGRLYDQLISIDPHQGLAPFLTREQFHVVTVESRDRLLRQQFAIPSQNIHVQPERRHTLHAILWTLAALATEHPEATIVVLNGDNRFKQTDLFRRDLDEAIGVSQAESAFVLFGTKPYVYYDRWNRVGIIQGEGRAARPGWRIHSIRSFEEKPDEQRAAEIDRAIRGSGGWLTQSTGVYVFPLKTMEEALERYQPAMFSAFRDIKEAIARHDPAAAGRAFQRIPIEIANPRNAGTTVENSLAYAILMPWSLDRKPDRARAFVMSPSFSWVDMGFWDQLRLFLPVDENNNVVLGDVQLERVRDSVVIAQTPGRLEVHDLQGLIVVQAANGSIMVAPEKRAAEVKRLAEAASTEQTIMIESHDCLIDPGIGTVAILGVDNLRIAREGTKTVVGLRPENERAIEMPKDFWAGHLTPAPGRVQHQSSRRVQIQFAVYSGRKDYAQQQVVSGLALKAFIRYSDAKTWSGANRPDISVHNLECIGRDGDENYVIAGYFDVPEDFERIKFAVRLVFLNGKTWVQTYDQGDPEVAIEMSDINDPGLLPTGTMFWLKDWLFPHLSNDAYSRMKAWWIELIPAILVGIPLALKLAPWFTGHPADLPALAIGMGVAFAGEHLIDWIVKGIAQLLGRSYRRSWGQLFGNFVAAIIVAGVPTSAAVFLHGPVWILVSIVGLLWLGWHALVNNRDRHYPHVVASAA